MDDKKAPLFSSTLFSSPTGSTSLNFASYEEFKSPISLAPALTKDSNQDNGQQTPPSGHTSRLANVSAVTKEQPVTTSGNISLSGLTTVSLDSPVTTSQVITSEVGTPSNSGLQATPQEPTLTGSSLPVYDDNIDYRGGGKNKFGWNDPPVLSDSLHLTPNRPGSGSGRSSSSPAETNVDNTYPIQPLASHHNSQKSNPPPLEQGPPQTSLPVGSNPYRIGIGIGSKKPTYGVSGVASFAPIAQSWSQPEVTPNQSVPQSSVQAFSQPPYSQGIPPSSSCETASLPPATSSTYPPSFQSTESLRVEGQWNNTVQPLSYHWFYLRSGEKYWIPFSQLDSRRLEESLATCGQDTFQELFVQTDGGRYDVNLTNRSRQSVYWEEPASEVRRCSWFYKGEGDRWYLPYDVSIAVKLEEEYLSATSQGTWNRHVNISSGESIIMHSRSSIVHYPSPHHITPVVQDHDFSHPKSVVRGFTEMDMVEPGEASRIDHLVFVVHGIGAHCDLNFRSLVDCVDDFREVSELMTKTHSFPQAAAQPGDSGGRVEFLPVHWHSALHEDECGVDTRLKPLTLPSISRLRDFTNSTLTDILFFTSPIFCQTIINQVATEMNRMYNIFRARNPSYQGDVSVMGHSLGACVLFDLLYHQNCEGKGSTVTSEPHQQDTEALNDSSRVPDVAGGKDEPDAPLLSLEDVLKKLGLESLTDTFQREQVDYDSLLMCSNEDLKELGVPMGPRKKLSSFIAEQSEAQRLTKERREREMLAKEKEEQRLKQEKEAVDAALERASLLGVKMVRGIGGTGQPFIDYPQLNFEPKHLFAVGSPIGLFLSVRGVEELGPDFTFPTCRNLFNIFHPFDPVAYRIEPLVTDSPPEKPLLIPHHKGRKRFHLELYENIGQVSTNLKAYLVDGMRNMWQQLNEFARSHSNVPEQEQLVLTDGESLTESDAEHEPEVRIEETPIGRLNQGARIDHVLQEKPIEKLNEYLFALSSHLCYWRSEDTALFILKEMYTDSCTSVTEF